MVAQFQIVFSFPFFLFLFLFSLLCTKSAISKFKLYQQKLERTQCPRAPGAEPCPGPLLLSGSWGEGRAEEA